MSSLRGLGRYMNVPGRLVGFALAFGLVLGLFGLVVYGLLSLVV